MFYKLVVFFALLAFVFATERSDYEERFFDWMRTHEVTFPNGAEFLKRLEIFIGWDKLIDEHNASGASWKMAHNQFSIYTQTEFAEKFLTTMPDSFKGRGTSTHTVGGSSGSSRDWVSEGAVTDVKNQGSCGSCWSFSTTGALEGAYYIKNNNLVSFSEQMLVSCDDVDAGCNGGLMDDAFEWIKENGGLCSEDDYPYTSGNGVEGTCKSSSCSVVSGSQIKSYTDVTENSESDLQDAVYQQPVSVAIQANQLGFQMYSSGVYTGRCGTRLDHGVLAVGYGTDSGTDYWKVKNSWGDSWGEGGYIRMEKGKDQYGGQCGILLAASYPSL
jgi:C1A family cysteine protease